jgi:endonuclease/exonuclease/phosphatase family metal-dependent hydrolase
MRLLGGYKSAPAVAGQVLLDAWEYADPAAPASTWNPRNPFVPPSDPAVRVDYVFVGPPGSSGLVRVRSVELVGDGPVDGVWPSDHAGVMAELTDDQIDR